MKKKLLSATLLASLVCTVSAMPAYALANTEIHNQAKQETADENITPCWEETEWYYRVQNGVTQKRLWSITEGKWLTDWVNC